MCSADTSKTGQEEAQRRSSDVGPDPKIRWSAACSSSSCHREFCIRPGSGHVDQVKWIRLSGSGHVDQVRGTF